METQVSKFLTGPQEILVQFHSKMRSNTGCSVKFTIPQLLILFTFVLIICLALLHGRILEVMWLEVTLLRREEVVLRCTNVPQHPQLLQHGDYWVWRYFVRGRSADCANLYTLTMQGGYEQIYALPAVYNGETEGMWVSFAAYVPDAWHLNRTLNAISYVRQCTPPARNGIHMIRSYVAFHLYCRFDQLAPSMPRHWHESSLSCSTLRRLARTQGNYDGGKESVKLREHAIIVGRNVAQLAAPTTLILNVDVHVYPSYSSFTQWLAEMHRCLDTSYDATDKRFGYEDIIRIGLVGLKDMRWSQHQTRVDREALFYGIRDTNVKYEVFPLSVDVWQLTKYYICPSNFDLRNMFAGFLNDHLYFLAFRNSYPLLPEHMGLTALASENLRMFSMALQNFRLTYTKELFIIHNITTADLMPRNQFSGIDSAIKKQFEIMYDDKNVKKLVYQ